MKQSHEIDELLKSVPTGPPLPSNFRSETWTRIAHAEQRSFAATVGRLLAALARPIPAAASMAATVLIGAAVGLATAPPVKDAQLRYVESISPFLREHTP